MSNLTDEIRYQVLKGNSALMRDLLLCKSDIDLLRLANSKIGITSSKLAELKSISIQNASIKLQKLFRRGYMVRYEGHSASGGLIHTYHMVQTIINWRTTDG